MAVDPPERDERERRSREERGPAAGPGRSKCFLSRACQMIFPHFSPIMLDDIQVGSFGARVGRSAVLQARTLLCKSGICSLI